MKVRIPSPLRAYTGGAANVRAEGATVAWTVFDPEGRMLGTVRVPAALRVLEIGDDWLLGVHRDEYDVQQLRLHTLQRAP